MGDSKQKERIKQLYEALKKKNKYAAQVCGDQPPEDPLQTISNSHNNTFLHMAIRFEQKDTVNELLEMLPIEGNDLPSKIKNNEGNTILHEVVSRDTMKDVAENVVKRYKDKDRELLTARNGSGETPIFCAARHGQTEMFKFLAGEMKLTEEGPEECKPFLRRKDGTTVLHISITTECFELANYIAENYKYLIVERGRDAMTALQYLACNPTAFERKQMKMTQGFEGLFATRMRTMAQGFGKQGFLEELCGSIDSKQDFLRSCSLRELIKLLVKEDKSCQPAIGSSKTKELEIELSQKTDVQESQEKEGNISEEKSGQTLEEKKVQNSQKNEGQNSNKSQKSDESPLFLAVISNIQEIVEEILICRPQMLEHTNKEGMNILHVAILYRHIGIFDVLIKYPLLPRSLLSATDNEGNSLLHMFGQKIKSQASERMQSPAFELQKELLFFQKVKSACKMHLTTPLNENHQTAEGLFATTNEELHRRAKEWLMRATENCTILSVFIATVAFAAVYTVPGGSDGSTGIPILNSKPFFVVFILADVISLTFAMTSVGVFLSILTSSFPLQHFETYLFKKLKQGIIFMILSISMMAVAFGATIVLIMAHNWKNAVSSVVGFLPVPIFFLSYSPLRSAVLGHCTESCKNFVKKFLKVVAIVVIIFLSVLVLLLYGAFKGLRWTVGKAFEFIICPPIRWICGNKSDTQSDTQV